MALILNLETATRNCSVAIARDGVLLASVQEDAEKYIHAEKLHPFILEACKLAEVELGDFDAIAVSNGPGSYTGLRIGISAAKGLCFALSLPLIAIDTTMVLVQVTRHQQHGNVLAVIDARRNEVYAQLFSIDLTPKTAIEAVEITPESWPDLEQNTLIVGDAAEKTRQLLNRNVQDLQCLPQASDMIVLSELYFQEKRFVDVAYHEPFYLKDFIAGKPRKLL